MMTHSQRSIPVPPVALLPFPLMRLHADFLPAPLVVAHEHPVLTLGIYYVRIVGIDLGLKPIAPMGDKPVGIGDAVAGNRPAGSAQTEVVLRAAVDIIKRSGIVDRYFVKLGDRQ